MIEDPVRRIEELLAAADQEFQVVMLAIIADVRDQSTLTEIARILESGDIEQALGDLEGISQRLGATWTRHFSGAGSDTAQFIRRELGLIRVEFNGTNEGAVAAMRENQLRVVQGFAEGQRRATREALLAGIEQGENPIAQARRFRDSIGLTANQVRAVNNYRRALQELDRSALERQLRDARFDRSVISAIENQVPLSPEKIEQMVKAYERRQIAWRAKNIARTEALSSVHTGADEMYRQAIETGALNAGSLQHKWNTARDERVRGFHRPMHGQIRPFGEKFQSGSGAQLDYPGDPKVGAADRAQCRCVRSTIILSEDEVSASPVNITVVSS